MQSSDTPQSPDCIPIKDTSVADQKPKRFQRFFKEPLLHFALLAALLFAFNHFVAGKRKDTIVVDQPTAQYLVKQHEDLILRKLSEKERQDLIESFIEDQILYKEAYKRGLDRGDSRMRRNLILKMRGLLIGDIKNPTEAQLVDYYETNLDLYTRPPTFSLDHVFFETLENIPGQLLEQLNAGLSPQKLGRNLPLIGKTLSDVTQTNLVSTFGSDTARDILAINDSHWHGPFKTTLGIHFFRITDSQPKIIAPYEDVKPYLEGDWLREKSRAVVEQEVNRIKDNYNIIIAEPSEQ